MIPRSARSSEPVEGPAAESLACSVELWDVVVNVRTTEAGFADRFAQAWPPSCVGAPRPDAVRTYSTSWDTALGGRVLELRADGRPVAAHTDPDALARVLVARIRQFAAVRTESRVVIHAGVVARGDRAVLLPGRTHTGKSTLVAALVRAGAAYCSDEYAVLDADGLVHPFPKPLNLRSTHRGRPALLDPVELGGSVAVAPLPVGTVVEVEYVPGSAWEPVAMSPGETRLSLIGNAVAARRRFTAVHRTVAAALHHDTPAWRGTRGEAADIVPWILERAQGAG